MNNDFNNITPIYIQITEKIKNNIVLGVLRPGDKVLSVRDLAMYLNVNPNTVQKALAQLESENLIYTDRTNGKFVTTDLKLINLLKESLANERIQQYIMAMQEIGIDKTNAVKMLEKSVKGE